MNNFYGLPIGSISNEHLKLEYLTSVGPRIVRLFLKGSHENLLAETPDISWGTPNGDFFIRGGHRLWVAPEDPIRTSAPDSLPIEIHKDEDFVMLREPANSFSGLSKVIRIHLDWERPAVYLEHQVENHNEETVELAPWAITLLPLGGIAISPFAEPIVDPNSRLPNRNLVLWPYTQLSDPRLLIEDDYLFIDGKPQPNECKIGCRNSAGWLGYAKDKVFFRKRFTPQLDAPHPDWGCNTEVYIRDRFIELESLGPLVQLQSGESVSHQETWEIFELDTVPNSTEDVRRVANQLSECR